MKPLIFAFLVGFACVCLNAQTNVWQPSPGHTQVPIWPGTPPDADVQHVTRPESVSTSTGLVGGKTVLVVGNVSQPTMTVYSPQGKNTGVAMVVFPGGGYRVLAVDLEGTEICDWLNSKGITAILLKYRVPLAETDPYSQPTPLALEDAQRTLGLVRYHAAEWHIDPHKIGVMVFPPVDIWSPIPARILINVYIRPWIPPTGKAAARILPSPVTRDICGMGTRGS